MGKWKEIGVKRDFNKCEKQFTKKKNFDHSLMAETRFIFVEAAGQHWGI
jgi:hypothetical protein